MLIYCTSGFTERTGSTWYCRFIRTERTKEEKKGGKEEQMKKGTMQQRRKKEGTERRKRTSASSDPVFSAQDLYNNCFRGHSR